MPKRFGLIADRKRVNEIARYYNRTSILIRDELMKLDAGDFEELKAIAVQNKINAIIRKMNRYVIRWSKKSVVETYKDGMTTAGVSLRILGAKKDPFFDRKIHLQAAREDEARTMDTFLRANISIKINVGIYFYLLRQAHNDIMQIQAFDIGEEEIFADLLRETAAEGGSRQDLQRLIRIHFKRDLYERKFITFNGRNYDLIKYAKNIARTRLREAQSDAVKNMCNQYNNDLVEISSHGTTCRSNICQPFEGNVYSINGKTPGYEAISEWPPYHNNCEHSAMPTSVEAIEWRTTH